MIRCRGHPEGCLIDDAELGLTDLGPCVRHRDHRAAQFSKTVRPNQGAKEKSISGRLPGQALASRPPVDRGDPWSMRWSAPGVKLTTVTALTARWE